MQTVKFRRQDGTTSEVLKGVIMLEAEDLYPKLADLPQARKHFKDAIEVATVAVRAGGEIVDETEANTVKILQKALILNSELVPPRTFASMQWRARNATRALLQQDSERLLILCTPNAVDAMGTAEDLVRELGGPAPIIAMAPTKFELFGNDKEVGIVTNDTTASVVVMPCTHLIDHPKWLGMLEACLSQNTKLKLILTGDATDVAQLSMIWPYADNALHADIVLEFSANGALITLAGLISHYQQSSTGRVLPFTTAALELLAMYACRLSGDRRYIGLPERNIYSLVCSASAYAQRHPVDSKKALHKEHGLILDQDLAAAAAEAGAPDAVQISPMVVTRRHMLKALCAQDFRNNLLAMASLREHRDRQLLIATRGAVVGQINGLSVIETLGSSYEYGEPVRITASLRVGGDGDVIDIERKAELAGQIHAKAMMIINGFLTKEFGAEQPLPVSASLVFEQSYSEIDGDSASLTGLCAVISVIAGVPIRQDLAVTGAVDQFGDVQAVGGVNEKIEGFYRVCRLHGFTGTQGVIIPSSCVEQLVLRPAVVNAVRAGKFHIFTVNHVTEAMKLLTTLDWGDAETEGTIYHRICTRLNTVVEHDDNEPWYVTLWQKIKEIFVPAEENELKEQKEHKEQGK